MLEEGKRYTVSLNMGQYLKMPLSRATKLAPGQRVVQFRAEKDGRYYLPAGAVVLVEAATEDLSPGE